MHTTHVRAASACSIGAGRMGRALLAAAGDAGLEVRGAWTPRAGHDFGSLVHGCDVVFVAVPDHAIASVVEHLAVTLEPAPVDRPLAVVTAGGVELAPFAERLRACARVVRIHPLRVVTADAPAGVLTGATAAVTAFDAVDLAQARELAERLGMVPVEVADDDASTWHAAASLAANALTAVLADAIELVRGVGLDEPQAIAAMTDLAAGAVDQVRRVGPAAALTGPVARGDLDTVAAHREAIAHRVPELLEAYDALAARTTALAGRDVAVAP